MNQRRDPEIDLRWEWFLFDLNQRANEYHRQCGQGDVRVVMPPARPRPIP
jgi:hypothetical protein